MTDENATLRAERERAHEALDKAYKERDALQNAADKLVEALKGMQEAYEREADCYSVAGFARDLKQDGPMQDATSALSAYRAARGEQT